MVLPSMGSYFSTNIKSNWLQLVLTPLAAERFIKKGVKGKSSFSFHWMTIAHVGGQDSEDSLYMQISYVCARLCVCV